MARRLVEAGVEIVTTELDGPLCGRVANWDDHADNHHVFDALDFRMPTFDQAVSALIEDVYDRGLDRRVLVVVAGEFGRTPRISHVASSGGGVASVEQALGRIGRPPLAAAPPVPDGHREQQQQQKEHHLPSAETSTPNMEFLQREKNEICAGSGGASVC